MPKIVAAVKFDNINLPLNADNLVVLFILESLVCVWIEFLTGDETTDSAQKGGTGCAVDGNFG